MPFASKAQQRFMFAAEARGEVDEGTARRWARETPDLRVLPEYAPRKDELRLRKLRKAKRNAGKK